MPPRMSRLTIKKRNVGFRVMRSIVVVRSAGVNEWNARGPGVFGGRGLCFKNKLFPPKTPDPFALHDFSSKQRTSEFRLMMLSFLPGIASLVDAATNQC